MKFSNKDIALMFVLVIATWIAMFLFGFQLAKRSNNIKQLSSNDLSQCLTELATCKKDYKLSKDKDLTEENLDEEQNKQKQSENDKGLNKAKKEKKIENLVNDNILKSKQIKPKEKDPKSLSLDVLSAEMKNKYTVQIGAFRNEYDAQQLTFSLYQDGFKDSYYRAVKIVGKGIWYRVGVGFFTRRSSAEVFANMLLQQGKIKSYAIRKL